MKAISRGARQQRKGRHSQMNARLPYEVFGFRLWDKIQMPDSSQGYILGRRKSGSFMIGDVDRNIIKNMTYRKLQLVQRVLTLLVERREDSQ